VRFMPFAFYAIIFWMFNKFSFQSNIFYYNEQLPTFFNKNQANSNQSYNLFLLKKDSPKQTKEILKNMKNANF